MFSPSSRYGARPMRTRTLPKRLALLASLVLLVGAAAACGGDDDDDGGQTLSASNGEVTIVAQDNEWNADKMVIPADDETKITVDNRDRLDHNFAIRDTDFKTDVEGGPVKQELDVTLDAGDYTYVCDVHPNMKGTLTAEEASS